MDICHLCRKAKAVKKFFSNDCKHLWEFFLTCWYDCHKQYIFKKFHQSHFLNDFCSALKFIIVEL